MFFRELINNESPEFCTGCGACVQKCHKGALELVQNEQGYYLAHFNLEACVNCNLCENVCPILYPQSNFTRVKEPSLYAVQMNNELRKISSSGGVFSALAEAILKDGGVVFGASWCENLSVKHIAIESVDDLDNLRRSKYVQSYIGDTFIQVKRYLRENRKVLFTGTPCQIAGLNAFLGKDDENLLTVDVLCLFAPSQGYFKAYLTESFPENNVVTVNMRDKRHGWRCSVLSLSLSLSNGLTTYRWDYNDLWEKAFLSHLTMSEHCAKCKFPCHQRQGDLTIGDFWEICKIDNTFDALGTNSVLINSEKGRKHFMYISKSAIRCKEKPLNSIRGNRIAWNKHMLPHPQAERFREIFPKQGFLKSADDCLTPHYDIAIMGCWEVRNYGSHLTYYALYQFLKSEGYTTVFIGCPGDAQYKTMGRPEYFKEIPYQEWEMHPQYESRIAMRESNSLAETFIVGSDQLWEPKLYRHFGCFSYLDFIHSDKRKIAYATSFGKSYWTGSFREKLEISYYLKRFDKVSVRELSGIEVCKDTFGIDADWNIDPVFLCGIDNYNHLATKSTLDTSQEYMAAYILDCTNEKATFLMEIAKMLGVMLQILPDPNIPHKLDRSLPIMKDFYVEDWIKWIRDSKYVLTDSFHGMCVSVIYKKNFIAFRNERRGGARFDDYGISLKISHRIIRQYSNHSDVVNLLNEGINYSCVNSIIEVEVEKSKHWLMSAIKEPIKSKELSDFDINSIKLEKLIEISEKKEREKNHKSRFYMFAKKARQKLLLSKLAIGLRKYF